MGLGFWISGSVLDHLQAASWWLVLILCYLVSPSLSADVPHMLDFVRPHHAELPTPAQKELSGCSLSIQGVVWGL